MIPFLATLVLLWDFSVDDGGFAPTGSPEVWEHGVPTSGPGGFETMWATVLDGDYLNDASAPLEVRLPVLTALGLPRLRVLHWFEIGAGDSAHVEIDDGSGWRTVEPIYGYPSADGFVGASWALVESTFELAGAERNGRVRFVLDSDGATRAAGWYLAEAAIVDGDAVAPRVEVLAAPADTQDLTGPYVFEVDIEDDRSVLSATLSWEVGGVVRETELVRDGAHWSASVPGQHPDTEVSWWIDATDGENATRVPAGGAEAFRVFLAAPEGLHAPTSRLVGQTVRLAWAEPVSPHAVVDYVIDADGAEHTSGTTEAVVPLADIAFHRFSVRARYDVGLGDATPDLALDVEVPVLRALEPAAVPAGDRVRLRLEGDALYLDAEAAALDLGDRVAVEQLSVLDARTLEAVVSIARDAVPGPRRVRVSGGWGVASFDGAFDVRDASELPQVVSVTPAQVLQGRLAELEVVVSEPFAGPVEVDGGPDLAVAGPVVVDGNIATVPVVARGTAAPGSRTLVLDDGERLWSVDVDITEFVPPPAGPCRTAPSPAGFLPLLALLVTTRRNRSRQPRSTR